MCSRANSERFQHGGTEGSLHTLSPLAGDPPPHRIGNFSELRHGVCKLIRRLRLRPIAHCLLGLRMHFNEDAIGAGRDGGPRHWQDFVASARAVRRISDDGQVLKLLHDGDRG